ncbi:VIT and vWA domain-containing protein [Tabrizicola sp.]|uniref:VIT and vWA domain-containing protein n=1 Tax=Tabrizicola sp. TaxID=2005166 RepID=UPI003F2CB0CA
MRLSLLFVPLFSLGIVAAAPAYTQSLDDIAGRVMAEVDGVPQALPMLDSHVSVNIEGDMATVEITQRFLNTAKTPVEAEYLFPLNGLAAVYGMEMRVGDEIIQAKIREKVKAEEEFHQAAKEGKAAALLTQHRPNMFTQRIANLMPDQPIEVTLRYVQMVPKIDGQYELVIPLIVGPRYESEPPAPKKEDVSGPKPEPKPENVWTVSDVPAYPPVAGLDLPDTFTAERVSLDLKLVAGVSVSDFGSMTHPLTAQVTADGFDARFADGKVLDNRDLVVHYKLGGDGLEVATLSHTDARGGFVSLMIEPPAIPDEASVTPRELVFVLDTSGSMEGLPMEASKRFMDAALKGLRPDDYFRIIPFAIETQEFAADAVQATPENIRTGLAYVNGLHAGGGTEIDNAIRAAFATEQPPETMRIVVFLSDGYIGDEATVLKTIHQQIGEARIYAFGIGDSVNRYLLDSMAEEGRGYVRYVGVDEDAEDVAETLAADLKSPIMTDLSIDWGGLEVTDVTPSRLPDLFAGNSLRIYARHSGDGEAVVTLKGLVQGREAEMPVRLTLLASEGESALPLIWARNMIADLTRRIAVGERPDEASAEITKLGLEFSLQTQNTSFVAVSEKVVNTSGQAASPTRVAMPMVSGITEAAYPRGFSGSSTPEPQAILGFLVLAAMTFLAMLRRRV